MATRESALTLRIDRARMALTDMGMSPDLVRIRAGQSWVDPSVTRDLTWRLSEVTLMGRPTCHACHQAALAYWDRTFDREGWIRLTAVCSAERRFSDDCGVSRGL